MTTTIKLCAQQPEIVAEAREWLDDCGADCANRSAVEIVREVDRQYAGGLLAFLRDGEEVWIR